VDVQVDVQRPGTLPNAATLAILGMQQSTMRSTIECVCSGKGPPVRTALIALTLLSIPLVFFRLGSYSVVNGDEAIYQDIALRMLETGDWLTLRSGNEPRVYDTFMNAPIQYWARAALVSAFGQNLWTMRILSAGFALATVLMVYRLVLLLADRRAAFLAGLIQLTTFQFLYLHSARTGELEPILSFLFAATAFLFIRALEDPRRGFVLHHLCLIALLNLKLPVILMPLLAELACFASSSRARARFKDWGRTGAILLPFGILWHVYQAFQLWGPFLEVVSEMGRHARNAPGFKGDTGIVTNLAYYSRRLLFGAFPYSLAYPLALIAVPWRRFGPNTEAESGEADRYRVLGFFALAIVIFYLLVSKHGPWYWIPLYPFLSALLGVWLSDLGKRSAGTALLLAVALLFSLLFWVRPEMPDYNPFARTALYIPMRSTWRSLGALGPALGVPLFTAASLALLLALRRALAERFERHLAVWVSCLLIAPAALRVALPLRHLGYQSPVARVRVEIDADRAAGKTLRYPIAVPRAHLWIVRYYFWRDFEIEPGPRDPATGRPLDRSATYELHPLRAPR